MKKDFKNMIRRNFGRFCAGVVLGIVFIAAGTGRAAGKTTGENGLCRQVAAAASRAEKELHRRLVRFRSGQEERDRNLAAARQRQKADAAAAREAWEKQWSLQLGALRVRAADEAERVAAERFAEKVGVALRAKRADLEAALLLLRSGTDGLIRLRDARIADALRQYESRFVQAAQEVRGACTEAKAREAQARFKTGLRGAQDAFGRSVEAMNEPRVRFDALRAEYDAAVARAAAAYREAIMAARDELLSVFGAE